MMFQKTEYMELTVYFPALQENAVVFNLTEKVLLYQ